MKKLLILHTGGTISMSEDHTTGRVSPTSQNPLLTHTQVLSTQAIVEQEDFLHLPSPHMTQVEMFALKMRIERAILDGFEAVVITHGTDTLEETAYFLDLTLPPTIPIVLTGAMRSSNELGSDGLINLQNAILVAIHPASYGKGVLVVMNDEIHAAKYVTKTHTTNLATFQTPTFGPLGLISKNNVLYFQALIHQEHFSMPYLSKQKIHLIKAYAGMDDFLLQAMTPENTDGLVIEALGAGNLPPRTLDALHKLLANHIPIVLVSRAFNGVTQDVYDYLGGGKQLKEAGIIFTTGLSGQKARLKLMTLLNCKLDNPLNTYF
ncbi:MULTISPECIES: asparaginase [unclassified Granulicatella]|uniref:asparaginase n=1 Tax=unclassified Granulicatella TaxID=2630493 RepID=UPI001883FDEA|nr:MULTISPECIES: asparaginase [unclassified Granulicatella]MBF0780326.1 asparaginase [Granulicatella sp. 19428wC4_WM01]